MGHSCDVLSDASEANDKILSISTSNQAVQGLSRLYSSVYGLFERELDPENPRLNGEGLLKGFQEAVNSFSLENCKESSEPIKCVSVIISWTDRNVGRQGRELFETHEFTSQGRSEKEYITHFTSVGGPPILERMASYVEELSQREFPSLTTLHEWAPSASFWVLGNPRKIGDDSHVTMMSLLHQFSINLSERGTEEEKRRYATFADRVMQDAITARGEVGSRSVVSEYLSILEKRYAEAPQANESATRSSNIYHVPKYGVNEASSNGKSIRAPLEYEAIFGFCDMKEYGDWIHYIPRAIHLFLDLMSSFLFQYELRQSASRRRSMEVEERSILHNLSYVFAPDSDIDRYVRSRLEFVSHNNGPFRLPMRPTPLNAIFSKLYRDRHIFTKLVKTNSLGNIAVALPDEDVTENVLLPGGISGVNRFRIIFENLLRNAAKHASKETIERLRYGTSHLDISVGDWDALEGMVAIELLVPLYGEESFANIKRAYEAGVYLLTESLQPSSTNMGSQETLLCCLSLINRGPQYLIGEQAVKCVDVPHGWNVVVKGVKLLEVRSINSETLMFRWGIYRSDIMAVVCDSGTELDRAGFVTIESAASKSMDVGRYMFLVGFSSGRSELEKAVLDMPVPRYVELTLSKGSTPARTLENEIGKGERGVYRLWRNWLNRRCPGPIDIVVIGVIFGPQKEIYRSRPVNDLDLTIHYISFNHSQTPDGAEQLKELLSRPSCVSCMLHGGAVPLDALNCVGGGSSRDGFLSSHRAHYVVRGWKGGGEFPSLIDELRHASEVRARYEALAANLLENVEVWRYRILVIDERSSEAFGFRRGGDTPDSEGLPYGIDFQASWALLGVDILFEYDRPGFVTAALARGYDYFLVHDAFLRDKKNENAVEALFEHLGDQAAQALIIHSDGSTFSSARAYSSERFLKEHDLFTHSWTGLKSVLTSGSKVQLIQLIAGAIRYSRRNRPHS